MFIKYQYLETFFPLYFIVKGCKRSIYQQLILLAYELKFAGNIYEVNVISFIYEQKITIIKFKQQKFQRIVHMKILYTGSQIYICVLPLTKKKNVSLLIAHLKIIFFQSVIICEMHA